MHQNRIKGEHAKKYAAKFGKQLNYPIFLCERERERVGESRYCYDDLAA